MTYKKWIFVLSSLILMTIVNFSYAMPTVLKAYQRCNDIEFPLRNGFLFVLNMKDQFFLPTDAEGNFNLDDEHNAESVMVYLANEENVIFAGCRSEIVPTVDGKVVLHGLCPSRNCR